MSPTDGETPQTRFRDGRGFFEAVYVAGWRMVIAALAVAAGAVVWLLWTYGVDLEAVGWGLLLFVLAALPMGGVTWLLAAATRTCSTLILAVVAIGMSPSAHAAYVACAVLLSVAAVQAWAAPEKD